MADENIQTADASATATTDPVQTAPVSAETQTADTGTTQAPIDQSPAQTEPTYLGGRFKSAEQLEAYALGLEKNQAPRAVPAATQPQTTTPTVDQLKFSKSHWRNEAFKAQAAGDNDAYQKASANLDWCEEQIYDARLSQESSKWRGQSAVSQLITEGAEMLKPYQADLVAGTPLNEASLAAFSMIKTAFEAESGRPLTQTQEQIISGLAVLAAAQKTGKHTAGATQKATASFADALNKAAKTAIVTGGGAATKSASGKITAEQIANMSDADFAKYEAGITEQSKNVPWSRHQRT